MTIHWKAVEQYFTVVLFVNCEGPPGVLGNKGTEEKIEGNKGTEEKIEGNKGT